VWWGTYARRALPRFSELRLVTEWFITIHAAFCTVLVAVGTLAQPGCEVEPEGADASEPPSIRKIFAVLMVCASRGTELALSGSSPAPYSVVHTRFGPSDADDKR
jgi:hypothetical protein